MEWQYRVMSKQNHKRKRIQNNHKQISVDLCLFCKICRCSAQNFAPVQPIKSSLVLQFYLRNLAINYFLWYIWRHYCLLICLDWFYFEILLQFYMTFWRFSTFFISRISPSNGFSKSLFSVAGVFLDRKLKIL